MVIPRSRSRSIESRYWARMSRASTAPVTSRMRSLRVVLPWSMWAMTLSERILARSMGPSGAGGPDDATNWRFRHHSPGARHGRSAAPPIDPVGSSGSGGPVDQHVGRRTVRRRPHVDAGELEDLAPEPRGELALIGG